jgi:hypothetical protein
MRSIIGRVAAALFAVVMLNAIALGSAYADEWFVGGAKLAAGKSAALATAIPVDEFAKLRINPGGGTSEVIMECTGANLIGDEAYISGGAGGMAKSLIFEKCSITKPTTGCALIGQPETILTNALSINTSLAGPNTKVSIKVHPLAQEAFFTLDLAEGSTCLFGAKFSVSGSVSILSSDGTSETATHTIMAQGSVENNNLETFGEKDIIEGGLALLKLASGSKWSFHA